MKKDTLIDIILNDLKEVQSLVDSFRGQQAIPRSFIKLTRTKLDNIEVELSMLEEFGATFTKVEDEPRIVKQDVEIVPVEPVSKPVVIEEKLPEPTPVIEEKPAPPVVEEVLVPEVVVENKITPAREEIVELETLKITYDEQPNVATPQEEKVADIIPAPNVPAPKAKPVAEPSASSILGETLAKEKKSLNDHISGHKDASKAIMHIGKPVSDIRKAIGINDRFLYQRELFKGQVELFNQTLDQLNSMDSYESASRFLHTNFKWEEGNEVAESFLNIVKRLFIKA